MCRQRGADTTRTRRGSQSAREAPAQAEDQELLDKGLKKGPGELCAKARTFSTVDTEGGLKLREGEGESIPNPWD